MLLILGQAVETTPTRERKRNRRQRRADQGKGARIGLDPKQVAARKQWLRGADDDMRRLPAVARDGTLHTFAASEPWIDAAYPTIADTGPDGEPIYYHFEDPKSVPTGFRRCCGCGHLSPPQCIGSSGHCDDCRYGEMTPAEIAGLPGSTSSVNLKKLRRSRMVSGEAYSGGF